MKGTKPIMYIRSEICLIIYDFLIICFVVGGACSSCGEHVYSLL